MKLCATYEKCDKAFHAIVYIWDLSIFRRDTGGFRLGSFDEKMKFL